MRPALTALHASSRPRRTQMDAPTAISDGIMREFARPLAELLVGRRSTRSMADRLTRRVRHSLRRSNWRLLGSETGGA